MFQGLKLPYRKRNMPTYFPGVEFHKHLQLHYAAVQMFGPYVLYERKGNGGYSGL